MSRFIGLLVMIMVVLLIMECCHSDNLYNDGTCSYCGGEYEYSQAVGHKYTTNYIYICKQCGHSIEVNRKYE